MKIISKIKIKFIYIIGNNTGLIKYRIDQKRTLNNDWKSFNINEKTGELSLNTKININRQSVYLINIIAIDSGRPKNLQSKIPLNIIVVDESNNAVQFDRTQICLSGSYKCDKYFQTLSFNIKEEQMASVSEIKIPEAKMNDENN